MSVTEKRSGRNRTGRERMTDEQPTTEDVEAVEAIEKIVYGQSEMVSVRKLKPHPLNPRRGDVSAVAGSLKANGQFRPVLVQRSTGVIVAGHHMVQAAKSLKWKEVGVVYLDVDDDEAVRIMLADNRTADLGGYDTVVLAKILKDMPEASVGTGYEAADVRAILAGMDDQDEALLARALSKSAVTVDWSQTEDGSNAAESTLEERITEQQGQVEARRGAEKALLGMDTVTEHRDAESVDAQLAEEQSRLEKILLSGVVFDGAENNYWGIPEIRSDMLVEELPDPIDTWARWDVTPDDGLTTWVYNYGVTNATKLPWDRTILSFFTWDERFLVWWHDPSWYTAKVMLAGCRMAIEPDFSMWGTDPRYKHLEAHYRSQFLARFFQEAGMRVIPRVHFHDLESLKYALLGIPKHAPVVAICIQAGAGGNRERAYEATETYDGLRQFIKEIEPEHLLVYGGNPARAVVEKSNLPGNVKVTFIDNFAAKRRGVVFDVARGKNAASQKENAVDPPSDAPDE